MQIAEHEVSTNEVKTWKGVHLIHFRNSSCSQKVRILLAEKGIDYTSHHMNLAKNEHISPWFLGVNPRGVVPVLIHDGAVHVESNDIMEYADCMLPSDKERFFPQVDEETALVTTSLQLEDSLHVHLRNITMGFLYPKRATTRSKKVLRRYERAGVPNASREKEVEWWRAFAKNGGVPEATLHDSLTRFRVAFDALDERLAQHEWLMGDRMSVLEVAWFISMHRLVTAGYPMEVHPRLARLYRRLLARESFSREVDPGTALRIVMRTYGAYRRLKGSSLRDTFMVH